MAAPARAVHCCTTLPLTAPAHPRAPNSRRLPPCSQYWPIGNTVFNGGYTWYAENVTRTVCQSNTRDDWCAACSGKVCTACYPRPQYEQAMAKFPITLDPATKRVSGGGPQQCG